MRQPRANWRWLFMHWMPWAFCLPLLNAGRSSAARMAMIAITTSSSISVNPRDLRRLGEQRDIHAEYSASISGALVRLAPASGLAPALLEILASAPCIALHSLSSLILVKLETASR